MKTKLLKDRFIAGLILSAFIFLFIHSEVDVIHPHNEDCAKSDLCLIVGTSRVDNDHKIDFVKKISPDFIAEILIYANRHSDFSPEKDCSAYPHKRTSSKKLYITNKALLI